MTMNLSQNLFTETMRDRFFLVEPADGKFLAKSSHWILSRRLVTGLLPAWEENTNYTPSV